MIFDYVAGLGSYAFRRVPNSDVPGLLALMDKSGVDKTLVSALECVMYRNVQAGNELLAERLEGRRDRLIAAAVVNPTYPRAAEDARLCLTEMGMKALRLYPEYHGYDLAEEVPAPGFRDVMAAAAELGAPVSITFEIEDSRGRHPMVQPRSVAAAAAAAAIRAYPGVQYVLEQVAAGTARLVDDAAPDARNWSVTTSGRGMLGETVHVGLADVLERIGPERVLLGTNMPLQYPRCAFMKLDSLDLDEDALGKIKGGNAARLLGL